MFSKSKRPQHPEFIITCRDAAVDVVVDWPDPKVLHTKDVAEMGQKMASAMHILANGSNVGGALVAAVGSNGALRDNKEFAAYVINVFNHISANRARNAALLEEDIHAPYILPSKAFQGHIIDDED